MSCDSAPRPHLVGRPQENLHQHHSQAAEDHPLLGHSVPQPVLLTSEWDYCPIQVFRLTRLTPMMCFTLVERLMWEAGLLRY